MKTKENFNNAILYFLDSIENIFYEETLNEYGSKHTPRSKIMRYVKELKKKINKEK